jgi:hypothetical protein
MRVSAGVPEIKSECPSVITLGQSWSKGIKAIYGEERALIAKQFGQLKTLRSRLGSLTNEVISWSLNNWQRFALQAKEVAVLPCAPSTPHIGFLLAHHDTARRMYLQSIANEKVLTKQKELLAQSNLEPKAPLSHGAAWNIYVKTETAHMKAKRLAAHHSYLTAQEAIEAAPEDQDAQARYVAAKNALEEQDKAEEQALRALGWGG